MATLLLVAAIASPLVAGRQPYIPDVTEAREQQWRSLTAQAQKEYAAGQTSEGASHASEALAIAEEIFDEDDPRTLISVNDLALNLDALHQDREAEALLRRAFDTYLRSRGEDDQNTLLAAENLIDFHASRKQYQVAQDLAAWALATLKRTTGPSSPQSRHMEQRAAQLALAATPPPLPTAPLPRPAAPQPSLTEGTTPAGAPAEDIAAPVAGMAVPLARTPSPDALPMTDLLPQETASAMPDPGPSSTVTWDDASVPLRPGPMP
ncbi:tetratricopeptide repeat protein [Sphingobium sp. H39-3-25]|uniref:tetratricopeptide repeat protein n=1 Tax=Sphingobium arseniciresistens TaxID=3030834 RepID=UPI0023B8B215|nr:tetratricopeptide repeat protein [Sphingobium arseniciresistens]